MKNILKTQLITSACLVSLLSSHAVGMEIEEENGAQVNRPKQFQDEVKKLYNRLVGEDHDFAEKDALAYMVRPEEEGKPAQTGHAVLSIIGGTEENPYFWAADFDGSYGTEEKFIRNIFWSTPGKIQILDNPNQINTIFFKGEACCEFSKWRCKAWPIQNKQSNVIKEDIKAFSHNPPLYSATGLSINLFGQDADVYNSSMWAQKIIKENKILEEEETINHMKIAGREPGEDSFQVWLMGSEYKRSHDAVPLFLKETGGCILDIFPLLELLKCKNPLKLLKILPEITTGMGKRASWLVNQIPEITGFVEEEISKNRKRSREIGEIFPDRAGNVQEDNIVSKRAKRKEQEKTNSDTGAQQ